MLPALRTDSTWRPLSFSPDFFGNFSIYDSARSSVSLKQIPIARHPPLIYIVQIAAINFI
jgi:hypothetical protein